MNFLPKYKTFHQTEIQVLLVKPRNQIHIISPQFLPFIQQQPPPLSSLSAIFEEIPNFIVIEGTIQLNLSWYPNII